MNGFKEYAKKRIKDRSFLTIIIIYLSFCVFSAVYFGIKEQTRDILLSLGFILFVAAAFLVEYCFKIRMSALFISASLFIAVGSILGSGYNFYSIFPFHDALLHGMSGFLFAVLGAALGERMFRSKRNDTSFFAILTFAFCFSLAIACVWEIFEFSCTALLGFDMMEDTIVTDINSYFLSGTHTQAVTINGIVKTIIYYGDGKTYIIDGYLDIGLIDTMSDMIICFVGACAFFAVSSLSYIAFPRFNELLIPRVVDRQTDREDLYV